MWLDKYVIILTLMVKGSSKKEDAKKKLLAIFPYVRRSIHQSSLTLKAKWKDIFYQIDGKDTLS